MDTIVSISTPLGSGAVGIVRMSGDNACDIAGRIFKPYQLESFSLAKPNMMYLGALNCGGVNDVALAVKFASPRSYTGEDVVELHCHGGISLVKKVYNGCVEMGARAADRGEFTRRAFLNGKLALSDAEGVADMINGDSAAAINAGYRLATGKTSAAVLDMERRLLDSISYMEAGLDYPEEMEEESRQDAKATIDYCLNRLNELLSTCAVGKFVKDGIKVAIVGVTNVGKSSLFNALVGKDRAIVTDIAGTTRDSIDEIIEADGIALRLIDTAGIRDSDDTVESAGIERARRLAKSSDIVVFVTDGSRKITQEEEELLSDMQNSVAQLLVAVNKCDLERSNSITGIEISAKTGKGVQELKAAILHKVIGGGVDESAELITSQRHKDALQRAKNSLESALSMFGSVPSECSLLDMRSAYRALGEITGDTADEGIIDNIFSKFCLGK